MCPIALVSSATKSTDKRQMILARHYFAFLCIIILQINFIGFLITTLSGQNNFLVGQIPRLIL